MTRNVLLSEPPTVLFKKLQFVKFVEQYIPPTLMLLFVLPKDCSPSSKIPFSFSSIYPPKIESETFMFPPLFFQIDTPLLE